jgi:hypothetical protein
LLLVGAPTLDTPDILDPRCRSSNHCIVIAIDSDWTSGVGSNPASEGVSSTDYSLVTEESSSSDIYDIRNPKTLLDVIRERCSKCNRV